MRMRLMTNYKFGEIVLVPFPFTDQTGTKKRPAIVVSSDIYNASRHDVVLMAVTSQTTGRLRPNELEIGDWKQAGLLKESRIKPIFTTALNVLILRSLGELAELDKNKLRAEINSILG